VQVWFVKEGPRTREYLEELSNPHLKEHLGQLIRQALIASKTGDVINDLIDLAMEFHLVLLSRIGRLFLLNLRNF
jgi:hypothetical protein